MRHVHEVPQDAPIVCTIRPGDDEEAGIELYRTLFADAYLTRERTASGVRWTFRDDEGIEARVRTLAAMEQRCCAFLRTTVSVGGGEVRWDVFGPDSARQFLDAYFELPETMWGSVESLRARASAAGLSFDDQRGPAGGGRATPPRTAAPTRRSHRGTPGP